MHTSGSITFFSKHSLSPIAHAPLNPQLPAIWYWQTQTVVDAAQEPSVALTSHSRLTPQPIFVVAFHTTWVKWPVPSLPVGSPSVPPSASKSYFAGSRPCGSVYSLYQASVAAAPPPGMAP